MVNITEKLLKVLMADDSQETEVKVEDIESGYVGYMSIEEIKKKGYGKWIRAEEYEDFVKYCNSKGKRLVVIDNKTFGYALWNRSDLDLSDIMLNFYGWYETAEEVIDVMINGGNNNVWQLVRIGKNL
jgi:hypothetical protein